MLDWSSGFSAVHVQHADTGRQAELNHERNSIYFLFNPFCSHCSLAPAQLPLSHPRPHMPCCCRVKASAAARYTVLSTLRYVSSRECPANACAKGILPASCPSAQRTDIIVGSLQVRQSVPLSLLDRSFAMGGWERERQPTCRRFSARACPRALRG